MSQYTKEVNELLLSIQQGDRPKLEDLFNKTAGHLLNIARQYLKNKCLAEDVGNTIDSVTMFRRRL